MPANPSNRDSTLRLLVVCNDAALSDLLLEVWSDASVRVVTSLAPGLAAFRSQLRAQRWDAVLHCFNHAGCTPLACLRTLRDRELDTPLLIIADASDQRSAMRMLRQGACDVVFFDRLSRLAPAVEREVREAGHRADLRAALDMLHDSETRFRALAANLPALVFSLLRKVDGGFAFNYVSEGSLRLLGLKQHELRGSALRFFDALTPVDRERLLAALDESAHNGNALIWEGRLKNKPLWLDMRSLPQRNDEGAVTWTGIATDITRSKETEAALRESRAQLAALSSHLEAVREDEREKIARDIHDELGSVLFRLKVETKLIASKLEPPLHAKAASIEGLLDQAMATAGRVARQLRPGILKEFGLTAAIECQAEDFAHSTGIPCRTQCDEDIEADAETGLALFRIVQEALTNVAKHALATLVVVRVRRENGNIHIEIRDNGRGIAPPDMEKPKSFGLRGIRERVQSLGGVFSVETAEQGGALLTLKAPARRPAAAPVEQEEASVQQKLF